MKEYGKFKRLSFDDILLVPQYSEVESRKQVNLLSGISRGPNSIGTSIPIIAAPMDTVCEWEMAVAIRNAGGVGVIHRYMSVKDQVTNYKIARAYGAVAVCAVGASGDYVDRAWQLYSAGCTDFLVDTANGHSRYAIEAVKELRKAFGGSVKIMAGNVSTYEGFARLQDAGADSIRVGIGGGSVCTTRIVSGHGMPTLSSIMDIRERIPYGEGAVLIADGGIRNSGDAAKALAAGAEMVMLGSMLAGTDESPGLVIDGAYKEFRGMASKEAQEDGRGTVSVVEGVSTRVPYKGSVSKVVDDLVGGLGSALSYAGANNLKEFYENSEFVRVTPLSVGESVPHAAK